MYNNKSKLTKTKSKLMKSTNAKFFFSKTTLSYTERSQLKDMIYKELFRKK